MSESVSQIHNQQNFSNGETSSSGTGTIEKHKVIEDQFEKSLESLHLTEEQTYYARLIRRTHQEYPQTIEVKYYTNKDSEYGVRDLPYIVVPRYSYGTKLEDAPGYLASEEKRATELLVITVDGICCISAEPEDTNQLSINYLELSEDVNINYLSHILRTEYAVPGHKTDPNGNSLLRHGTISYRGVPAGLIFTRDHENAKKFHGRAEVRKLDLNIDHDKETFSWTLHRNDQIEKETKPENEMFKLPDLDKVFSVEL